MKYIELANPYDFANPVTDEELFAGRQGELKDIKYYLDQGKKVKKPINLSLIGARAAGKTSLLNMIEIEAKKMDYLTVRIDLDEGDKENQITFFFKIFDSILNAAIEKGCFGGPGGKIFDEYLNQISAYCISDDIALKPFLFPVQYAKAMELGRQNVNTSEAGFKRDLDVIKKHFGGAVILLFDECNVLSESRILLEKIRNIFMNKENYMLVFTGTSELFPVIDDIFSPIIRQFKKINVCKFENVKDTEGCVNKPLCSIGIEPDEIFDNDTYRELHKISEGKPYEIQLVCHKMFMNLQEGKHDRMVLNHSVLEDVRNELETSQDFTKRPKLYDIKCLNKEQLNHLNILCRSLRKANTEDILTLEFITSGDSRVSREALNNSLDFFLEKDLLIIDKNRCIDFFGDEFDKLYTKYYARERGIDFEFNYSSIYENYYASIARNLDYDFKIPSYKNSFYCLSEHNEDKVNNSINYLFCNGNEFDNEFAYNLYDAVYTIIEDGFLHVTVKMTIYGNELYMHFFCSAQEDSKGIELFFNDIENKVINNEKISVESVCSSSYNAMARSELDERFILACAKGILPHILDYHKLRYALSYFTENGTLAHEHCKSLFFMLKHKNIDSSSIDGEEYINMSYIFMVNKDLDSASKCLSKAQESHLSSSSSALLNYNLGIFSLMSNNNCIPAMQRAKELAQGKSFEYSCLLVPKMIDENNIEFKEVDEDLHFESIIDSVLDQFGNN